MSNNITGTHIMWVLIVALICLTVMFVKLINAANERHRRIGLEQMLLRGQDTDNSSKPNTQGAIMNPESGSVGINPRVEGLGKTETRTHRPVDKPKTRPIKDWPQA